MVIADSSFWNTRKSKYRLNHQGENGPISVQIAGGDPTTLASAAKLNRDRGAQIIDINMGCPAKKVCNKAAGSALMKDESLVASILEQVVSAVDIPVTLKIRTGWDKDNKNALSIAKLAEESGIAAIAIHGRTRACRYSGEAEYNTIAEIKQQAGIPILANGDITTPEKAALVLQETNADGLLIGRAAQGCPWIFDDINHFLIHGSQRPPLDKQQIRDIILKHVSELHDFYGITMGVRIARKHVAWYLNKRPKHQEFRKIFNQIESPQKQLEVINQYFEHNIEQEEKAA